MTVRRIASFFKGLLLAGTGIVAGCSGLPGLGSSPGGTDPAVIAASIDELKTDTTWSAMTRSGDGVGARFALLESGDIPAAMHLVKAGKDAAFDLEMELFETPTAADEETRVTQAWILGKIGDRGSLTALGLGLSQSIEEGLFQAANAEADAIFALLGDSRRNVRDHWYDLADMEAAHAAASDSAVSALATVASAATPAKSCVRRMLILGADGKPLVTTGPDGASRPLAVEGWEFDPPDLPPELAARANSYAQEVLSGEGTPVEQFGGQTPNRRFNCAGFAFRELNDGNGWNTSAPDILSLLTGAGLLQLKTDPPEPGDKVFYLPKQEWWAVWRTGAPAHVTEVDRVVGGKAVVRAPDNQTGVFDANIDAKYFETRDWVPAVFEWTYGKPSVREDFAVAGTGRYCAPRTTPPKPCGDGRCDVPGGENVQTCSEDCRCGDGVCDPVEKADTVNPCYEDCGTCGDGHCTSPRETPANCEADCGSCGNGTCEPDKKECDLDEVYALLQCTADCCPGGHSVCPNVGDEWCTSR